MISREKAYEVDPRLASRRIVNYESFLPRYIIIIIIISEKGLDINPLTAMGAYMGVPAKVTYGRKCALGKTTYLVV